MRVTMPARRAARLRRGARRPSRGRPRTGRRRGPSRPTRSARGAASPSRSTLVAPTVSVPASSTSRRVCTTPTAVGIGEHGHRDRIVQRAVGHAEHLVVRAAEELEQLVAERRRARCRRPPAARAPPPVTSARCVHVQPDHREADAAADDERERLGVDPRVELGVRRRRCRARWSRPSTRSRGCGRRRSGRSRSRIATFVIGPVAMIATGSRAASTCRP